jgi:hypothetical protein
MSDDYDARYGSNPFSTASDRVASVVLSTDSAYTANEKVHHHRMMNGDPYYVPPTQAALDFDKALWKLFGLIGKILLLLLLLGALFCAGVLAISANHSWSTRDTMHGGMGRWIASQKLADYQLPQGEPDFGLEQMGREIKGGLGALAGKRPRNAPAYEALAYRCVLSERCWSEALASPARKNIAMLAWREGNRLAASGTAAEAAAVTAALLEMRIYTGGRPAVHTREVTARYQQRYPGSAGMAVMNARVQNSWGLEFVAWMESWAPEA